MDEASFRTIARNIIAVMHSIDPIDVLPDHDQSEMRIRFRQDPYLFFLKANDDLQARISRIAFDRLRRMLG